MNLRSAGALGWVLVASLLLAACGSVSRAPADGGVDKGSAGDSASPPDAPATDVPSSTDTGSPDKATGSDTGTDTGTNTDTGSSTDTGTSTDTSTDVGPPDTAPADRGPGDAPAPDGGGDANTGTDGGTGCPPAPAGIISWWHGEGDYTDAVGTNPGINLGGVTFATGAVGSGFLFNGMTSSYIEVADAASLRVAGPMTIDAWISPSVANSTGRIVDKITAGGANGYLFDVITGQLRVFVGTDGVMSGITVPLNTFTHVAGVYSGTTFSLYFNGVLIASKTTTVAAVPTAMLPLRIGADSTGANRFSGVIDEPRIFGRALSAAEIQDIYQTGSPAHCACLAAPAGLVSWWRGEGNVADARGTNTGSNSGGVTFATGAVGQGFNLSGAANSYVLVPSSTSLQVTTALTIEAWIDPAAVGSARIVDKVTVAGADGYYLDMLSSQLRFGVGSDSISSGATMLLVAGRFTHVAGVFDGTTLAVYINGVRTNKTTTLTTVPVNNLALHIGADSNGATRFSGLIDEARIYSRALSAAEIAAIASAGAASRCP